MRHAGVESCVVVLDGGFDVASHFGLVYIEVVGVGLGQSGSGKTGTVSAGSPSKLCSWSKGRSIRASRVSVVRRVGGARVTAMY